MRVGIYPPDPETFGLFHLGFEYFYEYLKGTRLTEQQYLDPCEGIVSNFFEDLQSAGVYFQNGVKLNSASI